jgi:hypothetical protein
MSTRGWYLIGMLVLLFLANLAMLMGMTNWPQRMSEGFATDMKAGKVKMGVAKEPFADAVGTALTEPGKKPIGSGAKKLEGFADLNASGNLNIAPINMPPVLGMGGTPPPVPGRPKRDTYDAEGFMDYLTSGFGTASIGAYDGINMAAGLENSINQGFKKSTPNVPLAGPPVEVGPDNLFYFKNNECKPECCPATLACDGGCVCSTPQQRDFINTRGGNRQHGDI